MADRKAGTTQPSTYTYTHNTPSQSVLSTINKLPFPLSFSPINPHPYHCQPSPQSIFFSTCYSTFNSPALAKEARDMKLAELEEARRAQPMLSRRHAIEAEKEREREIERSKDMATKGKDKGNDKDKDKQPSKKTTKKGSSKPKRKKSGGGGANDPSSGLLDDDELELMLAGSDGGDLNYMGGNHAGNHANYRGTSIGGAPAGAEDALRRNFQSALSLLSPQQPSSASEYGPGSTLGQGQWQGHSSQHQPTHLSAHGHGSSHTHDHVGNTEGSSYHIGNTEGSSYFPRFAAATRSTSNPAINAPGPGPGSNTTSTSSSLHHHFGPPTM